MAPWCVSGLEGLDDDHGPATTGAGLREAWRFIGIGGGIGDRIGLVLGRLDVEQLTGPSQVLGASAIGEEAVMADAVEARRQDVEEKAADELRYRQGHGLVVVWPIDVRDWNHIAMGHSRAGGSRPSKKENEDLDEQVSMHP